MRKIVALVILAVVAAAFFGLTVPRHVLKATAVIRIDVATRLNVRTRAVSRLLPLSEALMAREHRTAILL